MSKILAGRMDNILSWIVIDSGCEICWEIRTAIKADLIVNNGDLLVHNWHLNQARLWEVEVLCIVPKNNRAIRNYFEEND